MKNKFIITLLCCLPGLFLAGCQDEQIGTPENLPGNIQLEDDGIIPGLVRVKFRSDADIKAIEANLAVKSGPVTRTGITAMDILSGKYRIKNMKRVFREAPKFEETHRKHGLHLWYELELDTTINTRSAVLDYRGLVEIEYADPVRRVVSCDNGITIPLEAAPAGITSRAVLPFNDTYLGKQWHYDRGELLTPREEANIGLFPAWEVCAGSREVIVAVLDGGVDYNHEDLAANMWVNEAEKNGVPEVDDDDNGYVDDVYGYNFGLGIGKIVPLSHGTHVAGTVAAVNNNGVGVCGVAGGSGKGDGARLMSCQIFSDDNSARNQLEAMVYAADMGAVISQNSWGYTASGVVDPGIEMVINYFIEEAGNPAHYPNSPMRGGLVVFAAGNDGAVGKPYYPAAYENVVAVTATDYRNERASLTQANHSNGVYYANVADWVNLAAPGGMNETNFGVLSTIPDNKYGYKSGTSMACPHVSGVAALVVAHLGGPDFTCEKLKEILYASTLGLREYEPKYARYMGYGLIRADLALNPPMPVSDLKVVSATMNSCTLGWTVTINPPASYRLYYSPSAITAENYTSAQSMELKLESQVAGDACTLTVGELKLQEYFFAVAGVDRGGSAGQLSNIVSVQLMAPDGGKVYPTAVKDYATVALGSNFRGEITVSVYDAGGNRVLKQQYQGGNTFKINLSGLASGVYSLRVTASGAEKTMRVVKI